MSRLLNTLDPEIPKGYRDASPVITTGEIGQSFSFKPKTAPLWGIVVDGRSKHFRQAMLIRTFVEEGLVFAENASLGVFGVGNTASEAMDDFQSHIKYFHDYYKALPAESLIGEAVWLKKFYSNLFA